MAQGPYSPEVSTLRAEFSALSRYREADDPELIEKKTSLLTASLESYIQRKVADAPPFSDSQRSRLSALFAGAA
jgi:hypothetical protein